MSGLCICIDLRTTGLTVVERSGVDESLVKDRRRRATLELHCLE